MIESEEWGVECLDRFELYHIDRLTPSEITDLQILREENNYCEGIEILKEAWFREKRQQGFTRFYEEIENEYYPFGITFALCDER